MKKLSFALLLLLTGCETKPKVIPVWANATVKPTDAAPVECNLQPNPPVAKSGSHDGTSAAREHNRLMAHNLAVLKAHDVCGTWARGQRK